MELSLSMNVLSWCAALMVVICAWKVFNWVWLKPKDMEKRLREQGINGNPYKCFFGDTREMEHVTTKAKLKPINLTDDFIPRVMSFVHHNANTHGEIFFTWMGPQPLLHVTEPTLIREILANYRNFPRQRSINPITKFVETGLGFTEGDQWVKHRKIMNPAFHAEKLKHMLPAFFISCGEMIHKWEEMTKGIYCEVDVFPDIQMFTGDVISRTAFGSNYEEGKKIFKLQREQFMLVMKARQSMYIPGSRFFPTKSNTRMKEIDRDLKNSISKIIYKTTMKAGESSDDLLGMLPDSNDNEIMQQGNNNFGLSIDEIIEECKLFYVAGQETTANLLVWTMILLGQHTHWQDQAREEVLKVFKGKNPDIHGLNHLKVINMILHEVLRLYPPITGFRRMIHEATKLGNIILPAGSHLHLHPLVLHHDVDIWGNDVKEFKPERFVEGVSKATKGQASYLPFGGCPRICIGQNFAILEAKLALVMILQRFSFELSSSYSHAPVTIISLQPEFGAQLILRQI